MKEGLIAKEIIIKAKNCTGQKLQTGTAVYIEPDNRNWFQKLFKIKQRIIEASNLNRD